MDRDQIIAAVSRETGIKLSSADPVLAVVAINDVLLDAALARLDKQVKAQVDRMTLASTASVEAAKKQTDATITKAGEWAAAQIKAAATEAGVIVIADIRTETVKVERASRVAVRAAWATACCALVVVSGLVGIVISQLTHG
ncbi:MAG: hypothetical protein ACRYG8_14380 [Janthinobacterium lividum]